MMGSSRFPAMTGLVAAVVLFVGCLGVLIKGSTGHRLDGLQPMADTHRVNNVVPIDIVQPLQPATVEMEGQVQLAQASR